MIAGAMGLGLQMAAAPVALHVATNGVDTASGRLEGRAGDGALATLGAALVRARSARGPEGVTILVHDGVHHLEQPVVLTPEDSGVGPAAPLTIAAWGGGKPVLSGGGRLKNWQPVPGRAGWWTADAGAWRGVNWPFRSLFIDGNRAVRARTPNAGEYFRMDGARFSDEPFRFKYRSGDLQPGWASGGNVEVVAYEKWTDIRQYLRAVSEPDRVATLSGSSAPHTREAGAQYFVENAPGSLDAAGEWQLDEASGRVTVVLGPGQDPNRMEIVAPRLHELIQFRGDVAGERAVRHVVLRGLTLADTDWEMGPDGYRDTQAAVGVRGDLYGDGMTDCVIEGCTFTRLGGYGVDLGRGCQRVRVAGNEMVDLGAGGMRIGETTVRPRAFDATFGVEVVSNHLHQLGRIHPPAVGVFILQSANNRVASNHIHDLYYTAVSVGWTWGYRESPCHHNVIEFNHLHDVGRGLLSDMGAVYTLGPQPGSIVRNNVIHDVLSSGYGGWGLYPDEGSTGIVLENNIVYRCKSAGFHQHYGRENIVRNNVFAFNREHQLMRTRDEDHVSFYFTNNIVLFDSGTLLGSSWKNDRFVLDGNVYWDTRPTAGTGAMKFGGATFEQWRARGHDGRSLIADPRFVDAAAGDFRLREDSPARALGFRPIDPAGKTP